MSKYDGDEDGDECEFCGNGDCGGECQDEETEATESKQPEFEVPAILCYDSKSHGVRRFYKSMGNSYKPEFTLDENEALVFQHLDHLKLAGRFMRRCGYRGLNVMPKTLETPV